MSGYTSNEQDTTTSTPVNPDWRWLCGSWQRMLAFGFGSGLSRKAPGTMGTLVAIPIYLLLVWCLPSIFIFALTVPLFGLGVWVCHCVTLELGVEDHGGIVWDEIVAYLLVLSLIFNHHMGVVASLAALVFSFALFRLFDITKPFPIRTLERHIPGGFGIMIDDIFAAIYTLIAFGVVWGGASWLF